MFADLYRHLRQETDTIIRYPRGTSDKRKDRTQQVAGDPDKTFTISGAGKVAATESSTQDKSFYTIRPLTDDEVSLEMGKLPYQPGSPQLTTSISGLKGEDGSV